MTWNVITRTYFSRTHTICNMGAYCLCNSVTEQTCTLNCWYLHQKRYFIIFVTLSFQYILSELFYSVVWCLLSVTSVVLLLSTYLHVYYILTKNGMGILKQLWIRDSDRLCSFCVLTTLQIIKNIRLFQYSSINTYFISEVRRWVRHAAYMEEKFSSVYCISHSPLIFKHMISITFK
jgi:hypothetical protein